MKLLVAENNDKLPQTIKNFLHDQRAQFPTILKQFGFSSLSRTEQLALFAQTDGLAAQSTFHEKDILESVVHFFAAGTAKDRDFSFHIEGLIHQLNMWIAPDMDPREKEMQFGFSNYAAFEQNLLVLARRGQLFNIEENTEIGRVMDSIYNKRTHENEPYQRYIYRSMPVLFDEGEHIFHTTSKPPELLRRVYESITRI